MTGGRQPEPQAPDPPPADLTDLPPLDRRSTQPLYSQLAGLIEREIGSGRWPRGARVPSEPEFVSRFGLSRPTVRQALGLLAQQGQLERQQGRGTFVASAQPRAWHVQAPEGFFDDEARRQGRTVTSRVLSADRGALPSWASQRLGLPAGGTGVTLERLRSVDGLVALYVINHLPERFADVALSLEDPTASLYERLKDEHGVTVVGGHRVLDAVPADEHVAGLLECAVNSPVLAVESVSWDENLQPFDCYRAWLRSDRMKVELEVAATGEDPRPEPE
jgi:GntR family transcriptional regulator